MERVPSRRRTRSRSALPSPAAATCRIEPLLSSSRPITARRKPPFSTAMRQASSSSAWRSGARTMSALTALSISRVRLRRSTRRCCASSAPVFSSSWSTITRRCSWSRFVRHLGRRPRRAKRAPRRTWRRISSLSEGLSSTRDTPCACASACASCAAEVRGIEHERASSRSPGRRSGGARARSRPSSASARRRSPARAASRAPAPAPRARRSRAPRHGRRARGARPARRGSRGCRRRREWLPSEIDNDGASSCACLPPRAKYFVAKAENRMSRSGDTLEKFTLCSGMRDTDRMPAWEAFRSSIRSICRSTLTAPAGACTSSAPRSACSRRCTRSPR